MLHSMLSDGDTTLIMCVFAVKSSVLALSTLSILLKHKNQFLKIIQCTLYCVDLFLVVI